MAAVRHGAGIMAHHLIHRTIDWTRAGGTVAVSVAGVAWRRHLAHIVTGGTGNRTPFALRMAAVRHGGGIMAHHLIYATIHWARAWGTVTVSLTTIA